MHISPTIWAITIGVLLAVLLFDILIIGRKPHVPSTKECLFYIVLYIGLAIAFGIGIGHFFGGKFAGEYFAGWLTEYSLSIDNLFVFLIIMTKMRVPPKYQQFALLVGIVLALILRGFFIAVGAVAISRFSWVYFLFGVLLIITAVKLILDMQKDEDGADATDNKFMRLVRSKFPSTNEYHGKRLLATVNGKKLVTPMFLVILALGSTDLMFALDSIPAIYGLTAEPYLVFTANVFALMGLRQLYFLIGSALEKLIYLSYGLAIVLGFIGIKLILEALHSYHAVAIEISTGFSLAFIIITLVLTTVVSLWRSWYLTKNPVSQDTQIEQEIAMRDKEK